MKPHQTAHLHKENLWGKKQKKQQKQNTSQQTSPNQAAGAWPGLYPSTDLNTPCPDQSINLLQLPHQPPCPCSNHCLAQ